MAKRRSKTVEQQCRYYEVGNIFEYMVETYLNGNMSVFRGLYHELNKDARKDFIDFLLSKDIDNATYTVGIAFQRGKRPVLLWQSRLKKMSSASGYERNGV